MCTRTRRPETTVVSYETVDSGTCGTLSVLLGSTAAEEALALKTHVQSTLGWSIDDTTVVLHGPHAYVILFESASSKFIGGCSVTAAQTEAEKDTVHKELHAYINLHQIRELDVPEIYSQYDITTISSPSFVSCKSLASITIPDSITRIPGFTFSGCFALTTITIPDSVTAIGVYAFWDCTSLTTVAIPESVTEICVSAFSGCTSLTTVAIPESVTAIDAYAFCDCTSLTTITIPDSVTLIGAGAFDGCTSLTTVAFPASVTAIGERAFNRGTTLTTVAIGASV